MLLELDKKQTLQFLGISQLFLICYFGIVENLDLMLVSDILVVFWSFIFTVQAIIQNGDRRNIFISLFLMSGSFFLIYLLFDNDFYRFLSGGVLYLLCGIGFGQNLEIRNFLICWVSAILLGLVFSSQWYAGNRLTLFFFNSNEAALFLIVTSFIMFFTVCEFYNFYSQRGWSVNILFGSICGCLLVMLLFLLMETKSRGALFALFMGAAIISLRFIAAGGGVKFYIRIWNISFFLVLLLCVGLFYIPFYYFADLILAFLEKRQGLLEDISLRYAEADIGRISQISIYEFLFGTPVIRGAFSMLEPHNNWLYFIKGGGFFGFWFLANFELKFFRQIVGLDCSRFFAGLLLILGLSIMFYGLTHVYLRPRFLWLGLGLFFGYAMKVPSKNRCCK